MYMCPMVSKFGFLGKKKRIKDDKMKKKEEILARIRGFLSPENVSMNVIKLNYINEDYQ